MGSGSDDDVVGVMDMVHQLRAIAVELNLAGLRFAKAHGLHGTDVRALIALLDAERAGTVATPTWLRTQLALTSATTTALIDRMESAGHVTRAPGERDRRQVVLRVTDEARRLGWEFFGPVISSATECLTTFTADEQAVIRRYQRAMRTAIGDV
ncbi:MarR family winged helix-turn-helix transcriptional regulator [Williamsia sterculiae]|uniref:DNA-binding transcriptional regulator, MarR family n=1 Tax=Williamsia sterculiae TaxID=1344003 RepID=A0A1N7GAF2_9NOCA|nr:MarR family transcriptional regulator [Williamsia sterculiae]SIS09541.1 DNA-binding transcriptional regulator, MarR family [Williamsia sterculiae]